MIWERKDAEEDEKFYFFYTEEINGMTLIFRFFPLIIFSKNIHFFRVKKREK